MRVEVMIWHVNLACCKIGIVDLTIIYVIICNNVYTILKRSI